MLASALQIRRSRSLPRGQIQLTQCAKDFNQLRRLALIVSLSRHPRILLRAQDRRIVLAKNQAEAIPVHPLAVGEMANNLVGRPFPFVGTSAQNHGWILFNNLVQFRRRLRQHFQRIALTKPLENLLAISLSRRYRRFRLSQSHGPLLLPNSPAKMILQPADSALSEPCAQSSLFTPFLATLRC